MGKLRRKYTEKQISKAYAAFAYSADGQIVLWDLRDRFMERTSLDLSNHYNTIANEGKRFVVLDILSRVEQGELEHGRNIVSATRPDTPDGGTETAFDPITGERVGGPDSTREPQG